MVFPALVLNYFGQTALLLENPQAEALNILGGIAESKSNRLEAEEYYRAAL